MTPSYQYDGFFFWIRPSRHDPISMIQYDYHNSKRSSPMSGKKNRQKQKAFYNKTKQNQNQQLPGQDVGDPNKNRRKGPTSRWNYRIPTFAIPPTLFIVFVGLIQFLSMKYHTIMNDVAVPLIHNPGDIISIIYVVTFVVVMPIMMFYFHRKFHAVWFNNNAMYLTEDIAEYSNDAYIRTIDHLFRELDLAPDAGLGFDGHASTLMGHVMMDNKGINKIEVPERDLSVDGFIKRDDSGNIIRKKLPMFNPELADKLFSMSGVPQEYRVLYDAREYEFNPKLSKKEGGGKDEEGNIKRAGAYGRKPYDTIADYINNEFYPLNTETERPAGVYFFDSRPVNTILIAITRAGKGQTYIEPAFDVWTREKHKWNIFTTDPKGELLAKFYYSATVRGFDIVQFNLMHPHLTNVYNPLVNAVQAFRQNNPVKGTSLIDSIVDTLFPENGEIWNPAAGNMFRRAVYLLFDYYIEQEKYIRHLAHKNNTPQEVVDAEISKLYGKVTLANVYSLIGELAAAVSKDLDFINVNPDLPPVNEKDLLTLIFDAMSMLPMNELRNKAITANNAIKQISGAQQTISGIYATLLTGLSVYDDDTAKALMSGDLDDSFDVGGLGFPRRIGVHFDEAYIKKFRIAQEKATWTVYHDRNFTNKMEGKDYEHEEKISPNNWTWGYFGGIFENDTAYIKLNIETNGTTIKEFFFEFSKGYKKFDGITYVIDPITKKKIISGGTLVELDPKTKEPFVSTFSSKQVDVTAQSYTLVTRPILTSNQVFYSEKPKFVFAITPPHLQVYQKHILIIIKQVLDEQYSLSYVTKATRKPILGTRLMLEEFGNIRSGENGIPNIDTATSIALGQDVQITFVLQSFQQLRAIYGEDVEKILRANSSNTIFLKSDDEDLINELVAMSGTRHEFRVKSKSVSRKMGDIITAAEPVVNYSGEHAETTTLTKNDLLFLAGPSPGNSVTFSSGEMPIVGKQSTIIPMAAGLHKHLPQPTTGQYSDSNMPSTNGSDSINVLDNLIDGEALVRARVEQAKIWHNDVKNRVQKIAEREDIVLNERDGSVSEFAMNTVYEIYDKQSGTSHKNLSEPLVYWKVAKNMMDDVLLISDKKEPQQDRLAAVSRLRENLVKCAMDETLDELTAIYKDTSPTTNVNVGYEQMAVSKFVAKMAKQYPKPVDLKLEHQDVYAQAKEIDGYTEYSAHDELLFDMINPNHTAALEAVVEDIIDGLTQPIDGVDIDDIDGDEQYRVTVKNVMILDYKKRDENNFSVTYNTDTHAITKAVTSNAQLIQHIQSHINDGDY